ncbi:hypothetical protein [Saccharothrix obliqua]|uniref:hypothetical protein n=1 Tax=Saccharothrix obliqua TaxID=2861747 RepID=UPI001C6031FF|nr:hypothetical protein [Saccharothrix obliqua]MBW4722423.1 hypothetical protein [Saccharothrix obliqua]
MADEDKGTARRPRKSAATKDVLARLLEGRDKADADAVKRRQEEEAALTAFAEAEVEAQEIAAETDRRVKNLEAQLATVRKDGERKLEGVEARKADALLTLQVTGLRRSAEELSTMTGIGVKRVRAMLRDAREAHEARGQGVAEAEDMPSADTEPGTDASPDVVSTALQLSLASDREPEPEEASATPKA